MNVLVPRADGAIIPPPAYRTLDVWRVALDSMTAEVTASDRVFARPMELALGAFSMAVPGVSPDLRIDVTTTDKTGAWEVTAGDRSYRGRDGGAAAARRVDWIIATEAVLRLSGFIHAHAAVVATSTRSILLVGCKGSGKSTIAVALAQAGLTLYTDDVALIDRTTLRPISFPRPVKLDDNARRLLRQRGLTVAEKARLGESVARTALPGLPPADVPGPPLFLAIFLAPERGTTPSLRQMTAAEAALRLIQQSSSERIGRSGLSIGTQAMISAVRSVELTVGGLDATVEAILALVERGEVSG